MTVSKVRNAIYIMFFLMGVLILWVSLSFLPGPSSEQLSADTPGKVDISHHDIDHKVIHLNQVWETWPEKLYTPQELAAVESALPHESLDFSTIDYATHRMQVKLEPGYTYGISLRSSDYAMRIYLDGTELDSIGTPAATSEEVDPQVRDEVYYFTPQKDNIELVVQASNFVHALNGSFAPQLTIGTSDNIAQYTRNIQTKDGIVFGCLIAAFFYHLAMFLLNRKQRASLVFAFLCALMALALVEGFITFSTQYNWGIVFRLGYAATVLSAAALVILVNILFPKALHQAIVKGYLLFLGAYLIMVFATPTLFFTSLLILFQLVTVVAISYIVIKLAFSLKQRHVKNVMAVCGIGSFGLFSIYDILFRRDILAFANAAGDPIVDATTGIVFFVFCYAVVLSIEQSEINQRLQDAHKAIDDATTRYHMLIAEKEQTQSPPDILAHFGLTKRETEVALLLIDGNSREEISRLLIISIGTVNTHCNNIYKKTGCKSATELMSFIMAQLS